MASLSFCRSMAGPRAFTGLSARPATAPKPLSNGSRAAMKRRDTSVVEVSLLSFWV